VFKSNACFSAKNSDFTIFLHASHFFFTSHLLAVNVRKQQDRFSYFLHAKGMKNIMAIMKRPLLAAGTIVSLGMMVITATMTY